MKQTAAYGFYRFSSRTTAFDFANRGAPSMVILGDDGRFWVVTPAQGEKLLRAGYELAR